MCVLLHRSHHSQRPRRLTHCRLQHSKERDTTEVRYNSSAPIGVDNDVCHGGTATIAVHHTPITRAICHDSHHSTCCNNDCVTYGCGNESQQMDKKAIDSCIDNKSDSGHRPVVALVVSRGEKTRTSDLHVPNVAR